MSKLLPHVQKAKRYENTSKFGGKGKWIKQSIRTLRTLLPATASPLVKGMSDVNW